MRICLKCNQHYLIEKEAVGFTATAHKIAVLFYNAMRYGMNYKDPGADYYEQQYRERVIKQLRRRAAQFGFDLQPQPCE